MLKWIIKKKVAFAQCYWIKVVLALKWFHCWSQTLKKNTVLGWKRGVWEKGDHCYSLREISLFRVFLYVYIWLLNASVHTICICQSMCLSRGWVARCVFLWTQRMSHGWKPRGPRLMWGASPWTFWTGYRRAGITSVESDFFLFMAIRSHFLRLTSTWNLTHMDAPEDRVATGL